jgi:hypothetical protein
MSAKRDWIASKNAERARFSRPGALEAERLEPFVAEAVAAKLAGTFYSPPEDLSETQIKHLWSLAFARLKILQREKARTELDPSQIQKLPAGPPPPQTVPQNLTRQGLGRRPLRGRTR